MGAVRDIEHDDMSKIIFRNEESGSSGEQIRARDQKLYMAMLMGNHHHKVRILFNTDDGEMEVYARIWARTDQYVVLKGGAFIPTSSIIDVDLGEG